MPIARATPEKSFFIRMITRDIALSDCVLDLLDNSIDGAKRVLQSRNGDGVQPYAGFRVEIELTGVGFSIKDNCGGIPLEDARDYAFHFGRRQDVDREPEESIGIYGIGMKRAMFKIGRQVLVLSSTANDAFEVVINVAEWEGEQDWEFPLEEKGVWEEPGTDIVIEELNEGVGDDFTDPAFENQLRRTIAQDYALFLQEGLEIVVNRVAITPARFELREGGEFQPAKVRYEDGPVSVELVAGMAVSPPEDDSAEAQQDVRDVDRFGWFVLCNERVVLAGDKTDQTVWGDDGFPRWHPQYNGFLGVAHFKSTDPSALPWTTTKRGVDETDVRYRRAVTRMKALTEPYIEYTNLRKTVLEEAKALEEQTDRRDVREVPERESMKLPAIETPPRVRMATISYRKPLADVRKAAEAMGNRNMPYKRVGIGAFEYFYEREVEE